MNTNLMKTARMLKIGSMRGFNPLSLFEILHPDLPVKHDVPAKELSHLPTEQNYPKPPTSNFQTLPSTTLVRRWNDITVDAPRTSEIWRRDLHAANAPSPLQLQKDESPSPSKLQDDSARSRRHEVMTSEKPILKTVSQASSIASKSFLTRRKPTLSKHWKNIDQLSAECMVLEQADVDSLTPRDVGRICDVLESSVSPRTSQSQIYMATMLLIRLANSLTLCGSSRLLKTAFALEVKRPRIYIDSNIDMKLLPANSQSSAKTILTAIKEILNLHSILNNTHTKVADLRAICDRIDSVGCDLHRGIPSGVNLILFAMKNTSLRSPHLECRVAIALNLNFAKNQHEWMREHSFEFDATEVNEYVLELERNQERLLLVELAETRLRQKPRQALEVFNPSKLAGCYLGVQNPKRVSSLVLLYIAKQQKTISNDVAQTLNRSLSNRKLNLAFPNSKILAVCLAGEPSETSNLFSALRNLNPALPSLFSSLFNSMQIHRLKAKNTESEQQVSFHLNQIDSIPSPRVQLTRKGSKAPNLHLFMTERMNSSANTMWSLVFKALLERYFIADIYYGWPHIAKISCDPDNVELSKFRSRLSAWMRTLSQSQQRDFERLNVLFSRSGSQSFAHTVLQTLSRMTTLIVPDISLALVETSFLKVDSNFHLDFQSWLLLKDFQEVASAYKLNETLAPVLSPLQDILLGSVKK